MSMTLPAVSSALVVDPMLMDRLSALRQTLAPNLTDAELELFALVAQRKGLDPFSGQIMAVKRNTRHGARVSYQTGIDGHRSLAERTGQYRGSTEAEFGPDCDCGKPPAAHPKWAKVEVMRLYPGDELPMLQPGTADWHEFVPQDAFMWHDKPRLMLAKCAEAQALRKAFPWVLGDLYIPEEMQREVEPVAPPPTRAKARESVAAKAAAIRGDAPADLVIGADTASDAPDSAGATETADSPDDDSLPIGQDDVAPEPSTTGEPVPPAAQPTPVAAALPESPPPAIVVTNIGPDQQAIAHDLAREHARQVAGVPALSMTAEEFQTAIAAKGLGREQVRPVALELFGGKPAAELTAEEWGRLYRTLVPDA